jgi:glycosyltransferase involved in cell wall biosynthesis
MNKSLHVPPVSICLVAYNRASRIPATLDSILAQSFSDFELIISDDASPDDTEEVCRDYAKRDSRIRYYRNSQNLGMPGNLNAAIRHARGTYIANLHDGDLFRSDLIEKWKNALDETPEAEFVFNSYESVSADGSRRIWHEPFCRPRMAGDLIAEHFFRTLTSCVWGTVMARASAYARFGLFNPEFGFVADVDMWLRMACGSTVAYVPQPLITLMTKEADHSWTYDIWLRLFWLFRVYAAHAETYRGRVVGLSDARQHSKVLRKHFIRAMLSIMKHRRWDRVREGFGMWLDSDDVILRTAGVALGRKFWQPFWYTPTIWQNLRLMDQRPITAVSHSAVTTSRKEAADKRHRLSLW